MLFELLISPLTILDNYFINSIIIALLGIVAFRIAFKVVGNIGVRGEIGSFLHWTIRTIVLYFLWIGCCIVAYFIKIIMKYGMIILIVSLLVTIISLYVKQIYNLILYNYFKR